MKTITLARKPFRSTVAKNILEHGSGGLNIDACRIGSGDDRTVGGSSGSTALFGSDKPSTERPTGGRFPANVILNRHGTKAMNEKSGELTSGRILSTQYENGSANNRSMFAGDKAFTHKGYDYDSGGAARFFKQVKS